MSLSRRGLLSSLGACFAGLMGYRLVDKSSTGIVKPPTDSANCQPSVNTDDPKNSISSCHARVITYTYDSLGRLTSITTI
jgi:YD repeat-containing protein